MPKRPITVWVLLGFVGLVLLDVVKGVVSNRVDAYLVDHPGVIASMWNIVDWAYAPHVVALVAIVGIWWWSQRAPEPGPTFVPYGLAEPPKPRTQARLPPLRTEWAGVWWEMDRGTARPYCPDHTQTRLQFKSEYRVVDTIPRGSHVGPYRCFCPTGDHSPPLGGRVRFFERDYRDAETIAEGRIQAMRREQQQV